MHIQIAYNFWKTFGHRFWDFSSSLVFRDSITEFSTGLGYRNTVTVFTWKSLYGLKSRKRRVLKELFVRWRYYYPIQFIVLQFSLPGNYLKISFFRKHGEQFPFHLKFQFYSLFKILMRESDSNFAFKLHLSFLNNLRAQKNVTS